MPTHSVYADGTPRPLFRGWLHGLSAAVAVPTLCLHLPTLPSVAVPGLVTICACLVLSSSVHLIPWKSPVWLNILTRIDKTSIVAICGASFWSPQLLLTNNNATNSNAAQSTDILMDYHPCQVPHPYLAFFGLALPTLFAGVGMLGGLGSRAFVGCACTMATSLYFMARLEDKTYFAHTIACGLLYGVALALYVAQVGGHAKHWGYHEWMHLVVVIAFAINARGLLLLAECQG